MAKLPFLNSKNDQTFWGGSRNKMEQLYFWAKNQIPNVFYITNSGSKKDLNLF
jgi:hypothetical protein